MYMRFSSVQVSHSVVSDSLRPHGWQQARLPCPWTPGACSNSCPLSWWCSQTISSCHPFPLCLQSFPVSGSFPMSQLFTSGGQSNGGSATVLPMNIRGWFPLRFEFLAVQGTLKSLLQHHSLKALLSLLCSLTLTSIHDYQENHSFDYMDLCWQSISLLSNTLSRFVITFLPRRSVF